tara:strand:+ start:555 stop:782 length:228 start_codon:yes stop_codon:yes gene_type:complete
MGQIAFNYGKYKKMKKFVDIKLGDLFTLERKLKYNPQEPTLWRKKSSRTACLEKNPYFWSYFGKNEIVYTGGFNA